ncbi:MAG: NFACT family protein [Thermomicrobiales bacterium]
MTTQMFDALTIAAIADELADAVVRGRIQRVQHVDDLTVAFEIYARGSRKWLTMSADSQDARLTFDQARAPVDSEIVSPLLLLLRKYARGARIIAVDQPRFDRLLKITIAQAQIEEDEDADVEIEIHDLVLELMGRHSNLILVDEEGRIRDSIKRVTPSMSRVRPILPGNQYTPPPRKTSSTPSGADPVRCSRWRRRIPAASTAGLSACSSGSAHCWRQR